MALRAVLWDLDGTIVDTAPFHFQAWQSTLATLGVDYGYQQFYSDFGRTNPELLAELFPDACVQERQQIADRKESAFRQAMRNQLAPLPGVAHWLGRLHAAGVKQVICSSAPMANIVAVLDQLALGDYFCSMISGTHLPKGKPDPAIFLKGAAVTGAAAGDCIVIEDSVHGVEAARRAAMPCIAVGQLAAQPERLAAVPGFAPASCLAVGHLEQLAWPDLDRLWQPV
jgi:beta-phosphoglucomutase